MLCVDVAYARTVHEIMYLMNLVNICVTSKHI